VLPIWCAFVRSVDHIYQRICENSGLHDSRPTVLQMPAKSPKALKEVFLVLAAAMTTCAVMVLWCHLRRLSAFRFLSPTVRSSSWASLSFCFYITGPLLRLIAPESIACGSERQGPMHFCRHRPQRAAQGARTHCPPHISKKKLTGEALDFW
jgi:hypothetical protein